MPERGTVVEDGGRDGDAARTEPTPDGGIALDGASAASGAEASTAGSTDADDSDTAHAADADSISIPLPRPGIVARIARRETRLTTRRGGGARSNGRLRGLRVPVGDVQRFRSRADWLRAGGRELRRAGDVPRPAGGAGVRPRRGRRRGRARASRCRPDTPGLARRDSDRGFAGRPWPSSSIGGDTRLRRSRSAAAPRVRARRLADVRVVPVRDRRRRRRPARDRGGNLRARAHVDDGARGRAARSCGRGSP